MEAFPLLLFCFLAGLPTSPKNYGLAPQPPKIIAIAPQIPENKKPFSPDPQNPLGALHYNTYYATAILLILSPTRVYADLVFP